MRGVNQFSIGLELPGPNSKLRDETEKEKFRMALGIILMRVPSITTVVRHKDIDSHKRDPGNGFDKTWVDGFGLKIAW
jgi:N-acetyl-anhydromuramyl-L-alanine amidase AmpD